MTLNRKIFSFATITLLVALTLSTIAAWYSIQGLMAIFAAAVVPIMIMGGSLELAKVVSTIWLHRYWDRCGWQLKLYLIPSVIALALLTSMGIFGFLSKAHSDQTLVSGDVGAKIAVYDTKIQTAKENIDSNRKALQQMDAQVDQLLTRTTDDMGVNRAVQVRRQQNAERIRLQNEIAAEQEIIIKLQDESSPIRAEVRKIEAEVGPIKYIAAMIYGDNPDSNLLESAVRWVIILIVFVFDPLALALVLAAQGSYRWLEEDWRKQEEEKKIEKFLESAADDLLSQTPYDEPGEVVHDNCGTPECCGSCDTAVDEDLLEKINAIVKDPEEVMTDDTEIIQPDAAESNEKDGNYDNETHHSDADENVGELESSEVQITEPFREPITEGVTLHEINDGYYDYQGKSMSKAALLEMRPEFFSAKTDSEQSNTSFGIEFPKTAKKGDVFVRVDILPNKVFKFSGYKWIEINKESSDSYLYDEKYIKHLISKIESGEYDIELLSENENVQIEEYLQRVQSQNK